MFEMFTSRARRVTVYANREAKRFRHKHVGPEHMMLGILVEGGGFAARALNELGADYDTVLAEALRNSKPRRWRCPSRYAPFSSETRQTLKQAYYEALQSQHNFLGTEHLLLGLLHKEQGTAAKLLRSLGVSPEAARERVRQTMAEPARYTRE